MSTKVEELAEEKKVSPFEGMSAEALEVIVRQQEAVEEKKAEAIQKIFDYKFKSKSLEGLDTSLTYGESQSLEKKKIQIADYNILGAGDNETIKALIEVKKLKAYEDAPAYELHFWATRIIMRTVDPLQYEGND